MTVQDPYQVLGVSRDASADAIKRAYRRLALRYHPDVATGEKAAAAAQFRQLAEAYAVLGDAARREAFDRDGAASGWARAGVGDGQGAAESSPWNQAGQDTRDAIQDLLRSAGDKAVWILQELMEVMPDEWMDPLVDAYRSEVGRHSDGDGVFRRRSIRPQGGGEIEVDVVLTPRQAVAPYELPFVYHLGPHLIEERLRIPAGARSGDRFTFQVPVDSELTLKVIACVFVKI